MGLLGDILEVYPGDQNGHIRDPLIRGILHAIAKEATPEQLTGIFKRILDEDESVDSEGLVRTLAAKAWETLNRSLENPNVRDFLGTHYYTAGETYPELLQGIATGKVENKERIYSLEEGPTALDLFNHTQLDHEIGLSQPAAGTATLTGAPFYLALGARRTGYASEFVGYYQSFALHNHPGKENPQSLYSGEWADFDGLLQVSRRRPDGSWERIGYSYVQTTKGILKKYIVDTSRGEVPFTESRAVVEDGSVISIPQSWIEEHNTLGGGRRLEELVRRLIAEGKDFVLEIKEKEFSMKAEHKSWKNFAEKGGIEAFVVNGEGESALQPMTPAQEQEFRDRVARAKEAVEIPAAEEAVTPEKVQALAERLGVDLSPIDASLWPQLYPELLALEQAMQAGESDAEQDKMRSEIRTAIAELEELAVTPEEARLQETKQELRRMGLPEKWVEWYARVILNVQDPERDSNQVIFDAAAHLASEAGGIKGLEAVIGKMPIEVTTPAFEPRLEAHHFGFIDHARGRIVVNGAKLANGFRQATEVFSTGEAIALLQRIKSVAVFLGHEYKHFEDHASGVPMSRLEMEVRAYSENVRLWQIFDDELRVRDEPMQYQEMTEMVQILTVLATERDEELGPAADAKPLAIRILEGRIDPAAVRDLNTMIRHKVVVAGAEAEKHFRGLGLTDLEYRPDLENLPGLIEEIKHGTTAGHVSILMPRPGSDDLEGQKKVTQLVEAGFAVFTYEEAEPVNVAHLGRLAAWMGLDQFRKLTQTTISRSGYNVETLLLMNRAIQSLIREVAVRTALLVAA
jgi:hypothetical protein